MNNYSEQNIIQPLESRSLNGWIPRSELQRFLNLKNTAMSEFAKKHNIRVSRIGKRVFYKLDDLINLLEGNSFKIKKH